MSLIFCIESFILGVRGHHFEYDVMLVDLLSEGLVEEVSLLEGGSKTRACC